MTLDPAVQRWWFIGCSGSGKTTWARRVAEATGLPHVELDGVYHQANWTSLDDPTMWERTRDITSRDTWVVDGNYSVTRALLVERPTVVISLDFPRRRVMWQIVRRSVLRVVRREELWNGNRESWRSLLSWNPERSVIRWSYTKWQTYHERSVWLQRVFASTPVHYFDVHSHRELREVLAREFGLSL